MSAAGCGCGPSATLWPAHSESASISPVVPTIGAPGSYRRISSPEGKRAMTSPSPGRLAERGSAGGFPHLGRRVTQGAVGRVRPPHLVQVRIPFGIGLRCVHQTPAVLLVEGHLPGQQEPGPQPRRLGAQGQHGGHSPGVPDPAGRDHRHRCHRVHHCGHQGKRGHLAPHVPTGLPTLRHDDIDSAGRGPAGLVSAAHRLEHESVGVVDLLDVAGGIPDRNDTIRRPASRASSRRRC